MHDTGTVLGGDIVAGDDAEGLTLHLYELVAAVGAGEDLVGMGLGIVVDKLVAVLAHLLAGLDPGHELLVVEADEVGALHAVDDAPGAELLLLVEGRQRSTVLDLLLLVEVGVET